MNFLKGRLEGFIGSEQKLGPLVRLFRTNFRPYAWRYAYAIGMMLIASAATAASAYIIKEIVNKIFIEKSEGLVFTIAGLIVVIYLIKGSTTYFSSVTLTRIGNSLVVRLQRQLYSAVLKQDIAFFQQHALGDIMMRISQNAGAARSAIDLIVMSLGRDLFTLVSLVAVMVWQNPSMSLLSLAIAPPAVYGITHLLKKVRTAARQQVQNSAQIITVIHESVQGIRVVKSFGLEDRLARSIR